jgi:hypothetical protein
VNVFDYFDRLERACARLSLHCDDLTCAALEGSNDRQGRILGYLTFEVDEDVEACLYVSERVVIGDDDQPNVFEYSYYLVIDKVEQWGWEIDLSHDPPVHRHTREHAERLAAKRVSLTDMIDQAWNDVSDYVAQRRSEDNEE